MAQSRINYRAKVGSLVMILTCLLFRAVNISPSVERRSPQEKWWTSGQYVGAVKKIIYYIQFLTLEIFQSILFHALLAVY